MTSNGYGLGLLLISQEGENFEYALAMNSDVENQAIIVRLET